MCIDEEDSFTTNRFKTTLLRNLNKRFPIHDIYVCAALLDPTLQNVKGISEYLANRQQSPEEFLIYMFHKMVPLNRINEQVKILLFFTKSLFLITILTVQMSRECPEYVLKKFWGFLRPQDVHLRTLCSVTVVNKIIHRASEDKFTKILKEQTLKCLFAKYWYRLKFIIFHHR